MFPHTGDVSREVAHYHVVLFDTFFLRDDFHVADCTAESVFLFRVPKYQVAKLILVFFIFFISVFDGWVMVEWLGRWLQQWAARGVSKILCPRFATDIRLVKQFAHNCYLPCCQCTEAFYHVSFLQINIYIFTMQKKSWAL